MRYVRLYLYFLRFAFSKAMEFRFDFFFRFLMDVAFYAVQIAFFAVIYKHTRLLGGWDFSQVFIFISGYFFVDAIHMTVFSSNLYWFPIHVNRGDLDYHLVRPVSSLFFVSCRDFEGSSFMNLLVAVSLLTWSILRYPDPFSAGQVTAFVGMLLMGSFLYYVLHMIFIIPVFWFHSNRGMNQIFWAFTHYMQRPDTIFQGWWRRILVSILPFLLMASIPAHVLYEGVSGSRLLHMTAVNVAAFLFLVWFWRIGLRSYSSASS